MLITFFLVGALSMLIMSFHYLESDSTGILKRKEIAEQFWYLFTFRTHIILGIVAISFGPFQFLEKLRNKYTFLHKAMGYVYTLSVMFSSLAGLIIAPFAMGGWITSVGFTMLSIMWLSTTIIGVRHIVLGAISQHRKWMFFSYALTFAAITQRTLLLIPLLTEIPFIPIYQLSAWLPWLINLCIANYLYKRTQAKVQIYEGASV